MLGKQWQARNSLTVGKHLPFGCCVAVGSRQPSPRAAYYRTIQYVYWIISFVRALPRLCPASFLSIYLATKPPVWQKPLLAAFTNGPMDWWQNCLPAGTCVCVCVCIGEGSRDKDSIWTNCLSWQIELGCFSQCFYNNCNLSFGNLLAMWMPCEIFSLIWGYHPSTQIFKLIWIKYTSSITIQIRH